MKQFISILFLQLLCWFHCYGQPTINERYVVNDAVYSIFGSVIVTDSCYYVAGIQTSPIGLNNFGSSLIRMNFDGTIDDFNEIANDTLAIGFYGFSPMFKTLDGNFAQLALAKETDFPYTYLFVKMTPQGDTLLTKYYPQFFLEDANNGKNPSTLIQNSDSSYFGLIHIQNDTNFLGGVTLFRLDKNGELLYRKNFYGISLGSYNTLRSASMVRYSDTTLVIGCAYRKDYGDNDEKRHHTKLLVVDTLGNLIDERTYWEDTLALDCYGLTKTADGGLLYCGRIGRYYPEGAGLGYILYRGQIVKLNADFTVDWKLYIGDYIASIWVGLRNIKPLSDTEFVAVGYNVSSTDKVGWLIKFNIDGEIIWERKYVKVPHFEGETNYAEHELYDVDITPDGGFVMVGQATNYYEDNGYLPGQKAWLVKTNSYGCLVPGCQINDISAVKPPVELDTTKNPPVKEPITWLYPNPASTSLFYYHHQDNFQNATAFIFNAAGEVVQKWEITENDITYDIDISQLPAGNYYLRVINMLGEPLQTERFVKI